jgi:hypothetical protein
MKKYMIIFLLGICTIAQSGFSQNQAPSGIPHPAIGYNDWFRGGNLGMTLLNSPNIIGTFWPSPMYFYTNGTAGSNTNIRMKINPTFTGAGGTNQYTINGFGWNTAPVGWPLPILPVNTSGYVGIGSNDLLPSNGGHIWTDKGPFSLLHLNGENFAHVQEVGYRPWMKIGMTVTSNDDLMYVGHKIHQDQFGVNEDDVTDAVFVWSDNQQAGPGPDNMLFIFTRNTGNGGINDFTGNTPNGREIMRLIATGNVGIGPSFNNLQQPQSTLHINKEVDSSTWLQITNHAMG